MADGAQSSEQLDSIEDYVDEDDIDEQIDEDDELDDTDEIEISNTNYDSNHMLESMQWLIDAQINNNVPHDQPSKTTANKIPFKSNFPGTKEE